MINKLLAGVALALASSVAAASAITFRTSFAPEVTGATGSGTATLIYDTVTHDLDITADWNGLSGMTNVAHIHCCVAVPGLGTVGVAVTPGTLPGFPVGVQAGHYEALIDLDLATSFTAGFRNNFGGGTVAGARAAFLAGMEGGTAYFNIHTLPQFPGGEIRGFLQRVDEPASLALAVLALAAAGAGARRRPV